MALFTSLWLPPCRRMRFSRNTCALARALPLAVVLVISRLLGTRHGGAWPEADALVLAFPAVSRAPRPRCNNLAVRRMLAARRRGV
jgi:hypothetical protein